MINDELERVRDILNKMFSSGNHSAEELLKVSKELDVLVVQYYREKSGVSGSLIVEGEIISERCLLDKLQIFERMYQSMRIVAPEKKDT